MATILRRIIKDESGSSVIEYGLATMLISIVIVGAVSLIGGTLSGIYAAIAMAFAG